MAPYFSRTTVRMSVDSLMFILLGPSQPFDQLLESLHGLRIDAVADSRSIHLSVDESRILQDLEVLRHRRLGQRKPVHDLTADAFTPLDQHAQDRDTRRVSQRLGETRKLVAASRVGVASRSRLGIGGDRRSCWLHGRAHRLSSIYD